MILSIVEMRDAGRRALGLRPGQVLTESQVAARAGPWFVAESMEPPARFDIFLSHAYRDRLVVIGTYTELRRLGFTVYVDWIHDAKLDRSKVTPSTADLLRQRMRQCDSLFYLTTEHAAVSKWMPWETGYFDGHDRKTPHDGHVAILPVLDEGLSAAFVGVEYLGLYCWADRPGGSAGGSRAVDIHRPALKTPNVRFDPWIGGAWP